MKFKLALISILFISASSIHSMGMTPQKKLFSGVGYYKISLIEEALKEGADVNLQNEWGDTVLIEAVIKKNNKIVKKLIEAGANVNLKNKSGNTALMFAARNGENEIVKQLIEAGANVNLKNVDGETALFIAVFKEYIGIIKQLLEAGADLLIENNENQTAIDIAKLENNHEILRLLGDHFYYLEQQKKAIKKYLPEVLAQLTAEYLGYPEKVVKKEEMEYL